MKINTKGFTLVELVVVVMIMSVVFLAISLIFPYIMSTFDEQKGMLDFQKKSLIDTTYLLEKISSARRFLPRYSSGSAFQKNSYGYFLNKFDRTKLPFFSIGLFDQNGSFSSDSNDQKRTLGIREGFLSSGFSEARGYIYFTEPGAHVIRRMDISGANMVTAYGQEGISGSDNTGSGKFDMPTDLSYDGTKYLYICDSGNSLIRRIDLDTNNITPFLGTTGDFGYNVGETSLSGTSFANSKLDSPLGVYATGAYVYIADTFNNRVRKADITQGKVFTLLGGDIFGSNGDTGSATGSIVNYPVGITGFSGGIIFADSVNGKIRYLNEQNGTLSTFAGVDLPNNTNTYSLDPYLKLDFTTHVQFVSGKVYFNDLSNGILYELNSGIDGIFGTSDDWMRKALWDFNNSLLINGDIENSLISSSNDIGFTGSTQTVYQTSNANNAPKSGNAYLAVDTHGLSATGTLTFPSSVNPSDGDILQIGGYTYEFDSDGTYFPGNIIIPRASTFADTFDNLKTELSSNASVIITASGANSLAFQAKAYGTSGNGLVFSGASGYAFSPSGGNLAGGVTFGTGTQNFFFDKKLGDGQQYKLSFFAASSTGISSDVLAPVIEVVSGLGNATYKITQVSTSWGYNEYLFSGINPSGSDSQRIEFRIKNGNSLFFDAISLTALGTRESDQSIETFRADILPGFFIKNTTTFVVDGYNRKLKSVNTSPMSITTIQTPFSLSDPKTLLLHNKEDFIGNSFLDRLTFDYFSYTNLASSKIQYSLSNGKSILKLVGNVGK